MHVLRAHFPISCPMFASPDQWIRALRAAAGPGTLPDLDGAPPSFRNRKDADAVLWDAAAAGSAPGALDAADRLLAARPGWSLADAEGYLALEVWTECELSALHALSRIVRLHPTPSRRARFDELCRWHIEHTQPDNATNRPWAVHVFARSRAPDAILYAETLLHNVSASDARHEPLSRWILLDAVRELELEQR
jgi:hypothetical protein